MSEGTLAEQIIELYRDEKKSLREVASIVGRSHVGVKNILLRHGVSLRSRKVAQDLHVKTKQPPHICSKSPEWTMKRSLAIERSMSNKTPEQLAEIKRKKSEGGKLSWSEISRREKRDKLEALNKARFQRANDGFASHNEKRTNDIFVELGYSTTPHTKEYTYPYEVDIFIESIPLVVEIDGPSHYEPIFGEEELEKQKVRDDIKNAHFTYGGFAVLRIIFNSHWSLIMERKLKKKLKNTLDNIVKNGKNDLYVITLSDLR